MSMDAAAHMSPPPPGPQSDQAARIVERLMADAALDPADLDRAARAQAQLGEPLRVILDRLGLISQDVWARAAAAAAGLPLLTREDIDRTGLAVPDITVAFLRENAALILSGLTGQTPARVALADPSDRFTLDALRAALGLPLAPCVAAARDIEAALDRLYGAPAPDDTGPQDESPAIEAVRPDDIERLRGLAGEAPIVRLTAKLIDEALEAGASDIHIEPFERDLIVRYRIDGLLGEAHRPALAYAPAIVSRLKILAGLDIAERRRPQDGRIRYRFADRDIDLRLSTVPALHGESVVIRVLEQGGPPPALGALGLSAAHEALIARHLDRRTGMILVTGPTGSGKTTTLYAALNRLNETTRKIITVEDPVEFQIDRVVQTQVKTDIGRGFAPILRSVLRQDPDILMIGEIRDEETARIAVQSALTGHLVLSTLHTNDAPGAVARLLDMGLEDYLITATVHLAIAQRLVRVLCTGCRRPAAAPPDIAPVLARLGIPDPAFFEPTGCDACGGRGFKGRTGLYEVFPLDDTRRRRILDGDRHLRDEARETLFTDGVRKAALGITTLDEVRRAAEETA